MRVSMATYLVTGATGFVGRALTQRLLAEGHHVRLYVRRPVPALTPSGPERAQVHVHVANLGDPNALWEAAEGVDTLYHCAAENSPRAPNAAYDWINVAATENVLNAARHAGVNRVVHLSCADATLVDRDRLNWKETQPLGEPALDALARSKLLAEELALHANGPRLEVCALRPAWVWGPGDRRVLPRLCQQAQRGRVGLCADGQNLIATVYIDNLVHALRLAETAVAATGRAIHVLDAEVLSASEFIGGLCRSLQLPAPKRELYGVCYARAWLSELSEQLGMPNLSARTRSEVVQCGRSTLLDGSAAVHCLGYAAIVSVTEGMQALAHWAERAGGPDAIAKLARSPTTQRDVESLIALANRG